MHGGAEAITWAALVIGLGVLALGAATLAQRRVPLSWMRALVQWKRWGWTQVLLGVWIMLETVPRVTEAPHDLVFGLSVVALVPLAGAVMLLTWAYPSRD